MSERIRTEYAGPSYAIQVKKGGSFWRRAWFLVSAIPRYLFTGSVKLP